jgi:hypothetical protein
MPKTKIAAATVASFIEFNEESVRFKGRTEMAYVKMGAVVTLLVLVLASSSFAKPWRGITPLKSTRADVERLFGEPNKLGRYEIQNERAYIFYSEGPCTGDYRNLRQEKCECLVAKDTVLRITVTLENAVKFRGVDKSKLTKTPLRSSPGKSDYSDLGEGIIYTVDDTAGMLTAVDYWPSGSDCKEIIRQTVTAEHNVWRGIRPLYSTRKEVEQLLGAPGKQSLNKSYAYDTPEEKIDVLYSEGPCTPSVVGKWNVPMDTVLRITVYPQRSILIADLGVNLDNYLRTPDPHIPNSFFWINREAGVMIQSQLKSASEEVISIEYSRSGNDKNRLCK